MPYSENPTMKGINMPLAEALENASDEEIQKASKQMYRQFVKKIILGTVAAVAAHFLAEVAVAAIDNRRANREITE